MKTTLLLTMFFAVFAAAQPAQPAAEVTREVTRQLRALPNHGVFDNLNYTVDGANVTLFGQVANPDLKASAEKAVEHVAGVASVDNELQVLPGDPVDDDIRAGVYRRLVVALQPGTAIHIVVDHQNVTLVGRARTEGDKNLAGILAHAVPLVANVTNYLIVAD
jgi:osmotically-inducible protein OsmY